MAQDSMIYGIHAVSAALDHHPENILALFCQKDADNPRLQPLLNKAQQLGYTVQTVSPSKMEKLAGSSHHQGIAASLRPNKAQDEKALLTHLKNTDEKTLLLVLEGVQDPHNLGACLRSAEALGVDAVILPKDNTAPLNATVSKAACGADQTLKIIQVSNLARCLENLQAEGVWIVGTSGEASTDLTSVKLGKRVAIVMGSEGKGLKRLTLEKCDETVRIPLVGTVSSLNVSVATGICLYECYRQRHAK